MNRPRCMRADLALDCRAELGESPVWHHRHRRLWWVDVNIGEVHAYDPVDGTETVMDAGRPIGAVAPRAASGMVAALDSGFGLSDDGRPPVLRVPVEAADPRTRLNDGIEIADGRPDGMAVDATGAVWIAIARAGQVHRYTPNGTLDLVVEIPVSPVTSCTFGGADLDTLFVTTARPRPPQLPEAHAGSLFALRPGVTGLPANTFAA